MLRRTLALVAASAALVGCKSQNPIRPDLLVTADTLTAYALTGTSSALPSALAVQYGTTVRVDGSASFDVAFDFDSAGNVVVSPVRLLVSAVAGAPPVGLQLVNGTFDSITQAPGGYYRPDTAIVVRPGQPFVVLATRATSSIACYYVGTPHIYAKVVVDSVFPATSRAIYLRAVIDPNCGYRSFVPNAYPAF